MTYMRQSEFTYNTSKGARRGQQYSLGVRTDPSINDVQSFAVILFFQLEDGTRVPVARVDNSPHDDGESGDIHVDRFDRATGVGTKEYEEDIRGWEDGAEYLSGNWKQLSDRYHRNHGDELRDDGANG